MNYDADEKTLISISAQDCKEDSGNISASPLENDKKKWQQK